MLKINLQCNVYCYIQLIPHRLLYMGLGYFCVCMRPHILVLQFLITSKCNSVSKCKMKLKDLEATQKCLLVGHKMIRYELQALKF